MSGAPVLVSPDAIPAGAVVCDVRFSLDGRDPRVAFGAGHLPGAVYVDLATALSGPADAGLGRHPLPSPEAFAAELGAVGIGDDDHVIGTDDAGGTIAARLVWMLRVIGRPASLLDGGIRAWSGGAATAAEQAASLDAADDAGADGARVPVGHGRLETGPPTPRAAVRRTPVDWPADALADLAEVERGVPELLDARSAARYRGDDAAGPDPVAGHIPGARSAPATESLGPDGRFKAPAALREQFAGLEAPVVSCGSGVTACHTLLALELAGVRGRLFPGSFSQWTSDPDRPVAVGTTRIG